MKTLPLFLLAILVPFSAAVRIRNAIDLVRYFQRSGQDTITGYLELASDIDFSKVSINYALGEYSGSCLPFSGSFNGNGFAIKNYKISSRIRAGVFCGVAGATIQNLVIDKSCFFEGENAGAVTPFVLSTANFTNVINRANVSGSLSVGGLVSILNGTNSVELIMNKCRNEGTINSTKIDTRSGGLIGQICNNKDMKIEIQETSHVGHIVAPSDGPSGGLVGFLHNNSNMNLVIQKCQSDSDTVFMNGGSTECNYGGFIGLMSSNSDLDISLTDSMAGGSVNGELQKNMFIGGLIGRLSGNDWLLMNCSGNINNINMTIETKGDATIGGFFGLVEQNPFAEIKFENNTNNGNITLKSNYNYVGGLFGSFNSMLQARLEITSFIQSGTISVYSDPSTLRVGGLIGLVDHPSSSVISIKNVLINGTIIAKSAFHSYVGSVVGSVAHGYNIYFEIDDTTFSGTINSISLNVHYSYVGGIVGHMFFNKESVLKLSDCLSHGTVITVSKSLYHYLSGFVALFSYNNNTVFSIQNSVHDGPLQEQEVVGECYYGGFIAEANNNYETDIVISNVTNSGKWNIETTSDSSRFAGIVGKIRSENSFPVRLFIAHSINKQSLSHKTGPACGLFCVDPNHNVGIKSTVMNSINKGDISGTNAYGISTKITYAFGVVSMGNAKGTVNSHSLWSDSAGIENIYVLDKTCNNCQSATQITKNSAGEYVIVGSNQRVDTVLNQISIDKQFGIIWTQELDLTTAVRVILDAPINKIVYVLPGSTFETVLTIHPFDIETLVPFNKTDETKLGLDSVFYVDTIISMYYHVTLNGIIHSELLIEHGTMLGNDKTLNKYIKQEYVFVDPLDSDIIYNYSTVVVRPMSISILQNVRVILELPYIQLSRIDSMQVRNEVYALIKKRVPQLVVTIWSNEQGFVSRIDLLVPDMKIASTIVTAINGLEKGENCSFNIMCLCTNASIEVEKPSLSGSSQIGVHSVTLIIVSILLVSALFH